MSVPENDAHVVGSQVNARYPAETLVAMKALSPGTSITAVRPMDLRWLIDRF